MKKLGIFLVIVLTLILAIPNISFAERFTDSFETHHSRSYYGHRDWDDRYYGHQERYERYPYYYEERHEWHPYYYGYYGSPYPYYYVPGPFYGPSVGLNFGFVFR
ncbi:MAG: hypothetical protein ACM3SR_18415 [Ignavibacteriales bacterium]